MRIRKRHVVTAAATTTAVLAVAAVLTYTSLVPSQVSRRFTDSLLRERGLQLELDAVRAAPHGEILLLHPRISTVGDSSRVLLRADAIRMRPRELRALLEGRVRLAVLRLERPRVEWTPGMLASGDVTAGPPKAPRFPRLKIERFEIVDARITDATRGGDGLVADHVDLRGGLDAGPDELKITLESARALFPHDSLQVDEARAIVTVRGDSIDVREAHVRTPRSQLDLAATLPWSLRRAHGTLHAAPLDLAEVARLLPRVPRQGTVQGDVEFDWSGTRWSVLGSAAGRAGPWTLADGTFDLVLDPGNQVTVRAVQGRVNGAFLAGQGVWGPAAASGAVRFSDLNLHALDSLRTAQLPAHRLQGSLRFRRAGARDSVRCELELGASTIDSVPIDTARIEGAVSNAGGAWGAAVHRAAVQSPLGTLEFSGRGDTAQVDADFVLRTPAIERLLRFAKSPGLKGDVTVTGRLFGSVKAPSVEAESRFGTWDAGPVTAWGGTLSLWGHDLGPHAELEAQLNADSLRLRGHVWRELNADLGWSHGALQITRSQVVSGDSLLAVVASVEPRSTDWTGRRAASTRVRVETLLGRLGGTEFRIEDPAEIWWRRGGVYVDSLELVTRGGRLQVGGTVDWAARVVDAHATVYEVDAELLKDLLRAHWPVQGVASGTIRVQGPLDQVRVNGECSAVSGKWVELPVDSVHVRIESDAGGMALRDLQLRSPQGSVQGEIRVGMLPSLAALWERTAQPAQRERLAAAPLEATLQLTGVDIARWFARGLTPALPRWGGRVSSTVTLSGTVGTPLAAITGAADGVHVGPRDIGAFTFTAEYRDEKLLLREMRVATGDQFATASAEVPVRLDFTRGVLWHRDREVRAHLELPRGSAAVVQRFIPLFEPPPAPLTPGTIAGQLDIDGKLSAPRIHGGFVVDDAAFTLRDMEELFQEVHAVGTFDGTTLKVTELRGRTGERGIVTGGGDVSFKGWVVDTYAYKLDIQQASVYSLPEISAIVSGQVEVKGARVANDRLLVPNITGTLDVFEARITQEFTGAAESQLFVTDAPPWLAMPGLTLRAEKGNVWIDNSLVEAELAGTLRIVRTPRLLDFGGIVTVKRGKYLDYLHYFNIKEGELDFSANPGFNPKLNIRGETGRPGEKTYVMLTGTALQPRLQFASDAIGKGEQEIQQELIGSTDPGSIVSKGVGELVDPLLDEARGVFGAVKDVPILRGLSELRGSVDPAGRQLNNRTGENTGALANLDLNVTAGVPLAEDVYLVYQHGLGGDLQQRVAVEWGLWRKLVLEGAWEREKITFAGPDKSQNAVDVNLKFRYER